VTLPHHGLGRFVSSHVPLPELSLPGAAWDLAAFSNVDVYSRGEQDQRLNKSVQTAILTFVGAGTRGPFHISCTQPVMTRWQPAARLGWLIHIALRLSLAWCTACICGQ